MKRRVLMSAFACSPIGGSENGIGWNWVLETARLGHDVTVLARTHDKAEIETAQDVLSAAGSVRFEYFDIAPWVEFQGWKKLVGYLYVYVWQLHALVVARRLHREQRFDLVHHITFGGIRFPSFLGALGIPLILGPLGGGEHAPRQLRKSYPLRGKIVDSLRDLSNFAVRLDPLMRYTFSRAAHIVLRTPESIPVVPVRYRHRVFLERDIGIDTSGTDAGPQRAPDGPIRVLYTGRSLYWKGMHLGIAAVAKLLAVHPQSRLSVVGNGPEHRHWRQVAESLGVNGSIDWIPWVDNREIGKVYREHDIFLFPSLHDAGATVIYEAAAHRLPIICLNLGASAVLVNESFGVKVGVEGRSEGEVISDLGDALVRLADNPDEIARLGANAREWAETQTWASRVRRVYGKALGAAASREAGDAPAIAGGATPRFSVVVPCFNYGNTLTTALDSVLAQRRDDVEIVLVDDASTDDTPAVAERYAGQITYLRNATNSGHPTSWGRAMAAARGDYLVNLDADDWLLPDYFDRADHALRNDVGVVVSSVYDYRVAENRLILRPAASRNLLLSSDAFRRKLLSRIFFRTPGMLIHRKLAEATAPPDPRIWNADWEFLLRASRGAGAYVIADPVAVYRIHGASVSGVAKSSIERLQKSCALFLSLTRDPEAPAYLEAGERRRFAAGIAELYLRIVGSKMGARDLATVFPHLKFAMELSGSESVVAALTTLGFFGRAVLEKVGARLSGSQGAVMSVSDLLPHLDSPEGSEMSIPRVLHSVGSGLTEQEGRSWS
jgi:glycosyltransferase involved in cell wall biosynthesis